MSDTANDSQIFGPVTILEPEFVAEPVAEPVTQQDTALLPPRRYPKRKAADDAIQKIKFVREWEGASESSSLFQTVANQINAEFANETLAADEMIEICDDEEDTVTVKSQDTTKDRSEDESGYESSFIDDDDQDDSCSGSDDDAEWQAEKKVKFESASSESEDTETSGEEEDDTECLEAGEGVGVEAHSLDIMESDASFFPPPVDFEQDVGPQNYSHEADLADMTWFL